MVEASRQQCTPPPPGRSRLEHAAPGRRGAGGRLSGGVWWRVGLPPGSCYLWGTPPEHHPARPRTAPFEGRMTHHEGRVSSRKDPSPDLAAGCPLVAVAGAGVLVVLMPAATDPLIIPALPLAGITLGCAVAFYAAVLARPRAVRRFGRA